jgi:arylsulfatase A-like enzyme
MIEVLDEGIGRILDVIEAEGLQQDTVVVFVSDNGGEDLFGGGRANGDLRGGKGTYTEGGIRVPFMIAWPRELPQGTVYTDPVMTIDILPTLAAMVGLRADELDGPDGVNLLPHLAGVTSAPPHTRLFWSNSGSIESDGRVGRAIRQGAWKGLWDRDDERWSLYDLGADPAESSDLSDARPELVEELARTHARWQAEVTAARSAAVDRGP